MANDKLILRTLQSPYGDLTRDSVLSQEDVDNNFLFLKGSLINTATTVGNRIIFYKIDGTTFSVPFSGGSGGFQNFQDVTTIGKVTTDDIQIGAQLGIQNITNGNIGALRVDFLSNNRIFQLPDASGKITTSVNGIAPDNFGNITITGVTAVTITPSFDAVTTVGSATTNSIRVGGAYSDVVSATTYDGFTANLESINLYKAGGINVMTLYDPDVNGLANVSINNLTGTRNHQLPNANGVYLVSINGSSGDSTGNINIIAGNPYITGASFSNNTLTLFENTGNTITTLINSFDHLLINNGLTASTYYGDGSHLTGVLSTDMTVTGGTYNPVTGVATFENNSGDTFNVTGFLTGYTDTNKFITGTTFINNTLSLKDNSGTTVTAFINNFSGLTVSSLSTTGVTKFVTATTGGTLSTRTFSANTVPFGLNGGLGEDANFTFDGTNLSVGNGNGSTQCGIILNANRGSLTSALNGMEFRVSNGSTGAPDTSKSLRFYNKGISYLQMGSSSANTHYGIFSTGMTINIPNLSSTGNSMVIATSTGDLSIASIPTGYTDTNFATTNLTATANRVHDWDFNDFSMTNIGTYYISANNSTTGTGEITIVPTAIYLIATNLNSDYTDFDLSIGQMQIRVADSANGSTSMLITSPTVSSSKGVFNVDNADITFSNSIDIHTGITTNYLTLDGDIVKQIPYSSSTDVYITGTTFSNNVLTLKNNTGGTVTVLINNLSGLTVNGTISATTISGGTLYGDGSNLTGIVATSGKITGATFNNNNLVLTNNTGGTVTVLINNFSGVTTTGSVISNIILGTTISGGTLYGDGSNLTGIIGNTNIVTGATFNNNNLTLRNNTGGTFSVLVNNFSGVTVNGTISATTNAIFGGSMTATGDVSGNNGIFSGLIRAGGASSIQWNSRSQLFSPVDGQITITNAVSNGFSSLNFGTTGATSPSLKTSGTSLEVKLANNSGYTQLNAGIVSATTISGTTLYGNGSNLTGIVINGVITASTFSNNILSLVNNSGTTLNTLINNLSGLTVNGTISATTISGGTLYGNGSNLTGIVGAKLTSASFISNGLVLTNNTGGTVNVLINNFTGVTTNTLTLPTLSGSNRIITVDSSGVVSATSFNFNFNTVSAPSYTCVLSDANINGVSKTVVEMSSSSSNTVIIPPNSAVTYDIGSSITFVQIGTGQTTISAGTGVTILSAGGALKLNSQYSFATAIKKSTNTWYLTGDITT